MLLRSVCCYHFPIHNDDRNLSSSSWSQGGLTMMMILVVDDKRSKSYFDQIKKSDRAGTWRLAPPTWPLWASPAPPLSHQLYFHNLYCHHAAYLKIKTYKLLDFGPFWTLFRPIKTILIIFHNFNHFGPFWTILDPEMQKAASMASTLVLFFPPAVLIFGQCTRKTC